MTERFDGQIILLVEGERAMGRRRPRPNIRKAKLQRLGFLNPELTPQELARIRWRLYQEVSVPDQTKALEMSLVLGDIYFELSNRVGKRGLGKRVEELVKILRKNWKRPELVEFLTSKTEISKEVLDILAEVHDNLVEREVKGSNA